MKDLRDDKLSDYLKELYAEFAPENVAFRQLYDYPAMRQFDVFHKEMDVVMATVTISPNQITVAVWYKRSGHTFFTSTEDPLKSELATSAEIDPLCWSFDMLRHANNKAVDDCYEWDWDAYQFAVSCTLSRWEGNLEKANDSAAQEAFKDVRAACQEIIGVAPSVPDVRALERKWSHADYDLPECVPADDYFVWDKHYLRALVIIQLLARAYNKRG